MDPTGPQRTIRLKERTARECRLTSAAAAFLAREHRPHLEVAPTGRRGRYRLTPAGHVGTIVAPDCRLLIRPKIPASNLWHLLDPARPLPYPEDRLAAVSGADMLDFLAGRLARLLTERAEAGLHRGYAERANQGPFLQGRLDLPAQLRDPGGRKDQLHCRFDDFTADVPCNQLPRATAELVLRSPLLGEDVKAALGQILQTFTVSSVPLDANLFQAARPDGLTEAYRPLFDLCRLLADSLTVGESAGPAPCPAFLLDMERVFERYVTAGVASVLAAGGYCEVVVQPLHHVSTPVAGQPDLHMRPDVTINREGTPVLVVDAKWKRLSGSPLLTEDVYQVLAYCTALGARQAVLVYPGRRNRSWEYRLERANLTLTIRTLRVVGSREACRQAVTRLVRAIKRALR